MHEPYWDAWGRYRSQRGGQHRGRGRGNPQPVQPADPSPFLPGTVRHKHILGQRAERGESLHHPEDRAYSQD